MIKICYFSGTGNTLWSAERIASVIGGDCELVNIGVEAEKSIIVLEADAVVLLFPAYAYAAPVVVRQFIKRAVFKTPYTAVLVTYGTSPGGALADVCRLLRRKEAGGLLFGRIPSVENYIALFGPQKIQKIEKRLEMQRKATNEAARAVLQRQTNRVFTFRPLSSFVAMLFTLALKFFYKTYKVSAACDCCGICEKVCPVSAITLRPDSPPEFSKKCEHCQGCMNWCPKSAIHFGRLNSRTPRYHHPEIGLADITR